MPNTGLKAPNPSCRALQFLRRAWLRDSAVESNQCERRAYNQSVCALQRAAHESDRTRRFPAALSAYAGHPDGRADTQQLFSHQVLQAAVSVGRLTPSLELDVEDLRAVGKRALGRPF
jgi:hypothetical protein